jgi:hypothetical protein
MIVNVEWLLIELLVLAFAIFELWSLRRADRAAKRSERNSPEDPPA